MEIRQEGIFDVIDVRIKAKMKDRFIYEKYPALNETSNDAFVEFWSFIRRHSVTHSDIYSANRCPKCNAELPTEMGEVCQCNYCKVQINSGDYDWVLCEITQEKDYAPVRKIRQDQSFSVMSAVNKNTDLSTQELEDKASNAYLQIQTAFVTHNPVKMKRFLTQEAFEKFQAQASATSCVFSRLFVNYATVIGIWQEELKNVAAVSIKKTYEKVEMKGSSTAIDIMRKMTDTEVIILERNRDAECAKGSLFMHQCPGCGAFINDTVDISCQYCNSVFNAMCYEWIVADILTLSQYSSKFEKVVPQITENPQTTTTIVTGVIQTSTKKKISWPVSLKVVLACAITLPMFMVASMHFTDIKNRQRNKEVTESYRLMKQDSMLVTDTIGLDSFDTLKVRNEILHSMARYYAHEGFKKKISVTLLEKNEVDVNLCNEVLFHSVPVDGDFVGKIILSADSLNGPINARVGDEEFQKIGQKVFNDLSFLKSLRL